MKPLENLASTHPLATGTLGVFSSLFSWLLAQLHFLAGIAADLSLFVSFGIAVLTFMILWRNWQRGLRLERNREERRDLRRDAHFEEQHLERRGHAEDFDDDDLP